MLERVINTVKKAEALVIKVETNYMNDLCKKAEKIADTNPDKHEHLMDTLIQEGKRLHKKATEEYDEEEEIIGTIIKKGKKKK